MLQCRKFFRLGNFHVFTHLRPKADPRVCRNQTFKSILFRYPQLSCPALATMPSTVPWPDCRSLQRLPCAGKGFRLIGARTAPAPGLPFLERVKVHFTRTEKIEEVQSAVLAC